jgi:hypothetical protein
MLKTPTSMINDRQGIDDSVHWELETKSTQTPVWMADKARPTAERFQPTPRPMVAIFAP